MAYSETLAQRLRLALASYPGISEKKMFGGLSFMLGGHMCCGVLNDDLVLRVSEADHQQALSQPHARPMDFTGRPMKGFIYVGPKGYEANESLARWVQLSISYASSLPPKTEKKGRKAR